MKLNEKINKKIDQIYSRIFDLIEDDNYKEAFINFRDTQLVKLFSGYLKLKERIKKEKHERVQEHIEYLQKELDEFDDFMNVAKSADYVPPWEMIQQTNTQVPSWDKRREEFIDSKFYELFFNSVESNKDTKEVFKFLINEMTAKFNLPESKIEEYKKFAVTYFYQRERVSIFYDLFISDESILPKNFNFLPSKKLSDVALSKGKLSLELTMSKEVTELMKRIWKSMPAGIASWSVPAYSIWLHYLKTEILKNSSPGTLSEIIITPDEEFFNYKYDTTEYWGNSVLIHERKHMEYLFSNFSREAISRNESMDRIKKILKNKKNMKREDTLREIVEITTSMGEDAVKNEFLAILEQVSISFVDSNQKKFQRSHKIKRQDFQPGNPTYKSISIHFPWKDLNIIFNDTDVSKIKKTLLKNAKSADQKQAIEDMFRMEESKYRLVIERVTQKLDNLISRFPYEKQFISHYLEKIPLLLWSQRLDYLENILKLKRTKTSNKTKVLL